MPLDQPPPPAPPPASDRPTDSRSNVDALTTAGVSMLEATQALMAAWPPLSASTEKLSAAIAALQSDIESPKMTKTAKVESTRRSYSYKYAGLDGVMSAAKPVLNKAGISVMHFNWAYGQFMWVVCRIQLGDEFAHSAWPVSSNWSAAQQQAIGSAMTYGRRYTVLGLLAIVAEEDDDGAGAQGDEPERPRQQQRPPEQKSAPDLPPPPPPPSEQPAAKRSTRQKLSPAELNEAVEKARDEIENHGVVPDKVTLGHIASWFDAQIGACADTATLKTFWQASKTFAANVNEHDKDTGEWIRQSYTARRDSLMKSEVG